MCDLEQIWPGWHDKPEQSTEKETSHGTSDGTSHGIASGEDLSYDTMFDGATAASAKLSKQDSGTYLRIFEMIEDIHASSCRIHIVMITILSLCLLNQFRMQRDLRRLLRKS